MAVAETAGGAAGGVAWPCAAVHARLPRALPCGVPPFRVMHAPSLVRKDDGGRVCRADAHGPGELPRPARHLLDALKGHRPYPVAMPKIRVTFPAEGERAPEQR